MHIHIYTWKHHKETPCIATFITNKQNVIFFFYKMKEYVGGTDLACGGFWYLWEGQVEGKGRMSEYSANTVYSCM
jgi:hypothetical protein